MSENKSRSSNGRSKPKYKRYHSGFYSGGIPITEKELNDVYIKDKDFYGTAKVRYRQKDQECKITKKGDTLRIEFSLPQRAVTPGQSVVIYKDDVCLGGGEISEIN